MNEYEEWKTQIELLLDSSWELHKKIIEEELKKKDIIIESLLLKLQNNDIEILKLEDICNIFNWEEQKGRKFLKMATQQKYAAKIGKQIIITKENLNKYLKFLEGKELTL